jgi:hypothetical protein
LKWKEDPTENSQDENEVEGKSDSALEQKEQSSGSSGRLRKRPVTKNDFLLTVG